MNKKWVGLTLAILAGAAILALPTPHGLSVLAHRVLAIAAFTVILWVFQVMNNGITAILMMALMIFAGVKPALVLSGYSSPQFWILLVVLFYGFAMQKTGLAQRLSFDILSLFPGTYTGILSAFFLIGLVLALGIPSMTVRTAIMVPIAWALVQSVGLAPQSPASALVMLTAVEMAVLPGCAILYGSLFGPVVEAVFHTKNFPLTWSGYAQVMTVPTILLCALLLFANHLVLKPDTALDMPRAFASERLKALGPIKTTECITLVVVLCSTAYWATARLHHLPSFLIGMCGLAVFGLTGIVVDADIPGAVSWTLLLFLGGNFSLASVVEDLKITDWLAGYLVPFARQLTFSAIIFVVVVAVAMLLLRFLDPTGFLAIPVLFLPISDVALAAGIPALVLTAPLVLAAAPFWATYENFWMAMGEGITSGQAFTARQRVALANTYAVSVLVTLAVSVGFWKLIRVL
jgi:solute carrier family 13 (sodium-dependent dicarboxylate transporter), member 2/3/5